MRRVRIDGLPVLRFTRRLSTRHWRFAASLDEEEGGRRWSVMLSPRSDEGEGHRRIPFVRVHVEHEDGRIEGRWSPNSSRNYRWTYLRIVRLHGGEPPPRLVVHELLLPRLAYVKRRLPDSA